MDGVENLRTFVSVADAGSLSAAARHLDIAASVVTKRIDQLESRVSTRLFKRSTKRVTLTEFGERYLPQARRLIHDYDEVFAEMSHSPRQVEGHIRIRVPTAMAIAFMAETLAKFQRQYPRVSLDVVLLERPTAVNPSEEGFDVSISGGPGSFPGVVDEPICPLNKWVCAAPAYLQQRGTPQHPRELARHDCLVFTPVGRTWFFESATGPVSVDVRPKLTANDQVVLTAAALRANGIAVLPSYAVAAALRAGTLVRLLHRFSVPVVWIKATVPEARAAAPHVRSLVAFLKARYAPRCHRGTGKADRALTAGRTLDGIENLRTFVAVADAGSLASAARKMGIAASVVTKRIDQLESRVRSRLFTRSTRRVTLTEMGSRYLSSVRRLMHDYDEVFAEMSQSPQQIEGNIRIKVPTSMTVAYLAETLAEFQQQFPLVSLDVALIDRTVNPSAEGFDIAVGALPISFPGVIDEPICPLHRFVCAAPSYIEERGAPKDPNELAQHDCLVFLPAGRTWTFESARGSMSVELRPRMSANDAVVLTAAALEGNGIALLPSYAVAAALRAGTLVRLLEGFTVPTVWMKALIPEDRAGIPRVRSLLAFLKARYSPVPPWDKET